jgi:hypothetical protein
MVDGLLRMVDGKTVQADKRFGLGFQSSKNGINQKN